MPEYLAPGVYVEEVDTGSKPIEGVSTSTTGMIGVTERGPVNVPILVTSYGEFVRWFGEKLDFNDFSNGPKDPHCYLPHAVQGFFDNGGKRLYITRILDVGGATKAVFDLHDRGSEKSALTMLLRAAPELSGGATTPIYVLNVNSAIPKTGTLINTDHIRIGGGSDAEYRNVNAISGTATHVALNFPLNRTHLPLEVVDDITRVLTAAPNTFPSAAPSLAGATTIVIIGAPGNINNNELLEIGGQFTGELRFVRSVTPDGANLRVLLDGPLACNYPTGTNVVKLKNASPPAGVQVQTNKLQSEARSGERVVYLTPPRVNFNARDHIMIFLRADLNLREARRIGNLGMVGISPAAFDPYGSGTVVENVNLADDGGVAPKKLMAAVVKNSTVITVDNRTGLVVGDVLRIGPAPVEEYATITALPNPSPGGAAPNAGNIVLSHPLNSAWIISDVVQRQTPPTLRGNRPCSTVVLAVASGAANVPITDAGDAGGPADLYRSGEFIRLTTAAGDIYYHRLTANAIPLDAQPVELNIPLKQAHQAGSPVAEREKLVTVQALDAGGWGNRLRISLEDEQVGLVSHTTLKAVLAPGLISLASAAGVECGTLLELINPITKLSLVLLKVRDLNRSTNEITLDTPLLPAELTEIAGLPLGTSMEVRSKEFSLTVLLMHQLDPTTPSRNETVIDSESFRYLSMDSRHSRYIQTVIGGINGLPRLSDHRTDGASWYIRVEDEASTIAKKESIRPGPEALVDMLPGMRLRSARHALDNGVDSVSTLNDGLYIGVDDPTPENRTGLQTLRNIDNISLVGCPGRTSVQIQSALINHCELLRYRFAVLDGPQPPNDMLADVQNLRQRYDTKYASIYHPWLIIPDPFPTNLANIQDYPIPPSGHVLGLIARIDIERGVHKPPANEVLRGITGLQRLLNKEQQDILNPYPVNINVIRDFRPNNRGIRVFGARVITSDPDWKYVNVRRLMIFIESSIDRGLQWVVFEPNAEPLWARVRRSISAFLTTVWRNGALEGTKPAEAYFVRCDRTTMTQADIDNGRLIVVIGVAPVKPAEFVIIRIGLWTAHAED